MELILTGNLTSDVEIKYFESGMSVEKFGIAVNSWNYAKKEAEASFYNVEYWNDEKLMEKYKKGDKITIQGYLKTTEYKDKKYHTLVANKVIYSGAYATLNGIVEKEEVRYTSNNVAIQFVKMSDSDVTLKILKADNYVKANQNVTVFGELTNVDKKLILNVMKTYQAETKEPKELVKFAEEELADIISEEEIPF